MQSHVCKTCTAMGNITKCKPAAISVTWKLPYIWDTYIWRHYLVSYNLIQQTAQDKRKTYFPSFHPLFTISSVILSLYYIFLTLFPSLFVRFGVFLFHHSIFVFINFIRFLFILSVSLWDPWNWLWTTCDEISTSASTWAFNFCLCVHVFELCKWPTKFDSVATTVHDANYKFALHSFPYTINIYFVLKKIFAFKNSTISSACLRIHHCSPHTEPPESTPYFQNRLISDIF
jgi:hypothetical protein